MDENTLYYFFSTIAQCLSALVSLLGVFVVFKLQDLNSRLESRAEKISNAFVKKNWKFLIRAEGAENRVENHIDDVSRCKELWGIFSDALTGNINKYEGFFYGQFNPQRNSGERERTVRSQIQKFLGWKAEFDALFKDFNNKPKIIKSLKFESAFGLSLITLCFVALLIPEMCLSINILWSIVLIFFVVTSIYICLVYSLIKKCFEYK